MRRADHQEYTIAKKDFENLYPGDFEDLNLMLLQGHLNHLPSSDSTYQKRTAESPKPGWDATGSSVEFRSRSIQSLIRLGRNRVSTSAVRITKMIADIEDRHHGPSDLADIEKVAVRSSLRLLKPKCTIESRAKRSSINLIKKLFHITCSSQNMKTKEILSRRFLLRLNLPDHRSVLTGFGGSSKDVDGDTLFQWSLFYNRMFILSNDLMKAQLSLSRRFMSMRCWIVTAQDGKRPKVDDQRSDLADDLKKAQDHISSTITSHKTKITTSMYKISHEESKTTS
ncbi:hypothetical protein Tco_0576374 [Tanacetum coccineum]